MLQSSNPEIRCNMGASPKARKKPSPLLAERSVGLWLDSALISRLHRQPSKSATDSFFPDSERMLHLADLAFGTAKRDKFKSEKVSKNPDKS